MQKYLAATDIIDWQHPTILKLANELAKGRDSKEIGLVCFEWVRDNIKHSSDYKMNPVTCSALLSASVSNGLLFC